MNSDIDNFVEITQKKNGSLKLKINQENRINIFKFLKEQGFRTAIIDSKRVYFLVDQESRQLLPKNLMIINDSFWNFLRTEQYTNCPKNLLNSEILECFLTYLPIKNCSLMNYYLSMELDELDSHELRIQTNKKYRHQWNIKYTISKLDEFGFEKTIDKTKSYTSDEPPIYFKRVQGDEFIVFNHYCSSDKDKDGFDGWIASYANRNHIGSTLPKEKKNFKHSFHWSLHKSLLLEVLEKKS